MTVKNTVEKKISLAREASAGRKKTAALAGAFVLAVVVAVVAAYFALPLRMAPQTGDAATGGASDAAGRDNAPAREEDTGPQREAFKQQLRAFQSEIEPALQAVSVAAWAADVNDNIFEGKEKALRAFDAGNYPSALALLNGAADTAGDVLQLAEERFRSAMEAASDAFQANDADVASQSITQALLLKPDESAAQALQSRIAVLPEVLELLSLLDKARAENNHRLQKTSLEKIVGLDPARKDMQERLKVLAGEMAERDFAGHIARGMDSVQRRDSAAAMRFLQKAKTIYPAREEVALLLRNIQRLDREVALESHLRAAREAVAKDDWASARTFFQKARAVDSGHAEAMDGEKLALRVLAAHQDIAGYLARPERLSSANVETMARAALQHAESFYQTSPGLEKQAGLLANLIAGYATPRQVIVRSDNKTEILVRGVGIVGKTRERTVSLKPGAYTFEGKRPGYRSKLIQVEVGHRGRTPEVVLICDERI